MNWYVMENKVRANDVTTETYASEWEPYNSADAARCPGCGIPISMRRWLPPFEVEIEVWGKEFGDVVWGLGDNFLVSRRLLELYRGHELTGFEGLEPVKVVRVVRKSKTKATCPEYFRALPTQSRGMVDDEASEVLREEGQIQCPECGGPTPRLARRIIFQSHTLPTEDVFYPRGRREIIASERFRRMFEENGLINAVFHPAERYLYDPNYLVSEPRIGRDDK